MRSMLALAVVALFAAVAHGELLYEDVPASVGQQRSLLQANPSPAYYTGASTKATATIYLLIKAPKAATLNSRKYGAAHFNARIKPTLRKFNKLYPTAHLNFRATYISGPTTLAAGAQGWLTYSFTVDIGPPTAAFRAALRSELRSVLRKRSLLVKRTRGNIA